MATGEHVFIFISLELQPTGSSELLPTLFIQHPLTVHILIFSSKTTEFGCDLPWMILFQKCVHWSCPTSKMAAMASDWLKNLKSLKSFFYRTTGFHESKFGSLVQILLGQFPIKILSVDPINYSWPPWLFMQFFFSLILSFWHPILLKLWFWVIWLLSFQSYAP